MRYRLLVEDKILPSKLSPYAALVGRFKGLFRVRIVQRFLADWFGLGMISYTFALTPVISGRHCIFTPYSHKAGLAQPISSPKFHWRSRSVCTLKPANEDLLSTCSLKYVSEKCFAASVPAPPPPTSSNISEERSSGAKPLLDMRNYILYSLIPLFLTASIPIPSFAQEGDAAGSSAATVDSSADFITDSVKFDSPLTRILSISIVVLLVYATVGVIALTINTFIVNRNEKREIAEIKNILAANPGLKVLSDRRPGAVPPKPGSKRAAASGSGNRQMRRMEAKATEREEREKKRQEKKLASRKAASDDEDSDES